MQINIAKNSVDRMPILFSYVVAHELRFKMIPATKNLTI